MKKMGILTLLSILTLAILAVAGMAAQGTLPQSAGKAPATIQNLKATAPVAGKSRCDTVTGTRAVQKNYSSAGYVGIEANAYNATTGAPVNVKWYEDNKQVWVGSSYSAVNDKGTTVTTVTYKDYSSAIHSTGSCVRRQ